MPHSSTSSSKRLRAALVLAPLLIIGIVDRFAPVGRHGQWRQIYAAIEPAPDIVLLGNSITRTAFDEAAIASALSASGRDVSVYKYHLSASGAAVWYLVLKNVILKRESKPSVVVLGTRAHLMFDNGCGIRIGSMYGRKYRSVYWRGEEPVLEGKIRSEEWAERSLSGHLATYSRLYGNRERYQKAARSLILGVLSRVSVAADAWLGTNGASDRVTALAAAARGENGLAPLLQEAYNNRADREVFMAEVPAERAAGSTRRLDPAEIDQTLLPEIAAMCKRHGVKLIVVRHRIRDVELHSIGDEQYWLSILSYLSGHHPEVAVFDLQECVGFKDEYYYAGSHVTPQGQQILSKCLSEYLLTVLHK